jgi:VCBS repeat-containing protein
MVSVKNLLIKLIYATLIAAFLLAVSSGFGAYKPAIASASFEAARAVIPEEQRSSKTVVRIANSSYSNLLAAGDENWDALFGVPGMDASVYALVVDSSGILYAGGSFTSAGGVTANYVARWDGTSWTGLGGGMDNTVLALAVDSAGNLYAGGDFITSGGILTNRIARWDGTSWHPLGSGMNNPVSALTVDENDNLYAGGSFSEAGGVPVGRIARWDGSQWNALGSGMNAPVRSLSSDLSGNVYAGGVFTSAGGVDTERIARWDGSQWHALGSGLNNIAWAMQFDEAGSLYVGGGFNSAGGSPANHIARWDGTSWYPVGGGVDNIVNALALDGDGRLSVGGDFTTAGGSPFNYIARWDGTNWLPLGSGMDEPVRALATNAIGDIFVGGDFSTAGDKVANYIAWWHRSAYPPVANDDSYTTPEDVVLIEPVPGVLGNDTDADGNRLTATVLSGPGNGALNLNIYGSFVYTPTLDFNGFDFFTYIASDGRYTDTASVTITVGAVNDPPFAVGDVYTTTEDTGLIVPAPGVLSNDSDVEGDPLTASANQNPSHGVLTLSPDGSFSYTPAENYNGPDSFTYDVSDGFSTSTALVSLAVTAVNDPPVALGDSASTDQNTPVTTGPVLANDSDVDGDDLVVYSFDDSATQGLVVDNGDGTFDYDPNGAYDWLGTGEQADDSFTYTVSDGNGGFDSATVTITISGVNDAPLAVDDSYDTNEDTALSVLAPGVLGNDTDPDDDLLTALTLSDPLHGTLSFNASGAFTYTPEVNYHGPDSFDYQISDGFFTSTATVNLTVNSVNDPPIALDDSASTDQDTPVTTGNVLGNDSDVEGDVLYVDSYDDSATLGLVTDHGDGTFGYDPNGAFDWLSEGEQANDAFAYTAADGNGGSDTATVTIVITGFNDAPVPLEDSYTTDEDLPLVVAVPGVLGNDTDVDGDALTALALTDPAHGTLLMNLDGSFTYNPDENYFGPDSFTYEVSDGVLTATSVVDLTINSVNDPPVALGDNAFTDQDTLATTVDVIANDTDVEGDALYVDSYDDSSTSGLVTYNGDGTFDYDPNGQFDWLQVGEQANDIFTYTAADGNGGFDTAAVTVMVTGLNDAPLSLDDSFDTEEDTPLVVSSPGVLLNDSDVDDDLLTAVVVDLPAHGTLAFNSDGSFTYTPESGYSGLDSFTYHASDGQLESELATVNITVNPLNDAPLVEAGADKEVAEGELVSFSGSFTDPGMQGGNIQAETILWEFGDGSSAEGTLTPSHAYADNGYYTVTLTVTDDQGAAGSDWLLVVVSNVAPALDALDDRSAVAGEAVSFNFTFSDPGLADMHSFTIDWGDGEEEDYDLALGMRELETSHTYGAASTFTASVTVMDDDGGQHTLGFTVTVVPSEYTFHLPVIFRQP